MFFLCSCTLNWVAFWWHNSFSYTFLLTLVNCLKIDIGFFLKTLLAKYCKNFDGVRISPAINLSGVPSFFGYQKIGRAAICHIFVKSCQSNHSPFECWNLLSGETRAALHLPITIFWSRDGISLNYSTRYASQLITLQSCSLKFWVYITDEQPSK